MKLLIPLIILFAILNFIANENLSEINFDYFSDDLISQAEGINKSNEPVTWADYHFDVTLLTDQKTLEVQQKIVWTNYSENPTDKIYLNLFANSLKNYNSEFKVKIKTEEESSGISISSLALNDKDAQLVYPVVINGESNDSSAAFIRTGESVEAYDSVVIKIEYKIKIPLSSEFWGYAEGRDFYLISDWYPKIAVLSNEGWICNKTDLFAGANSEFANYSMTLRTPKNYKVGSGANVNSSENDLNGIYYLNQSTVKDFAWFATEEIIFEQRNFELTFGKSIRVELFIQPEKKDYIKRYFDAAEKSITFLDEKLGGYSYEKFTIVDIPRTSSSEGLVFTGMATFKVPFISPIESHQPELDVAKSLARQYFGKSLLVNNYSECWIEKGISGFIASEIMKSFYGARENNFKLFSYYPINGLNFLSYNEIPIVYTLGSYKVSTGVASLEEYYKSPLIGSISDPSNIFRKEINYKINAEHKPQLMLECLSSYLGNDSLINILSKVYQEFRFKKLTANTFLKKTNKYTEENLDWFFENTYFNSRLFDYAISAVSEISENEYEVFAERRGDGIFRNEVVLITENDTLSQFWNGEERWKIFKFETNDEVIAAEIDPQRINIFDINFANNSKRLDSNFWPPISLATRWFFWMQNALMILGSI